MMNFEKKRRFRKPWTSWPILIIVVLLLSLGTYWAAHSWYTRNLAAVNSSSAQTEYFTVVRGSTVHEIGVDLKKAGLIRSEPAFETYIRGRGLFDKLQAGTYALSKTMSAPQIVDKIVNGDVSKNLVTIPSGKTLKQIKKVFEQAGYADKDLEAAFIPGSYAGHPLLASLPAGISLEGLLYPDSFQKESDTPPQNIVVESLTELQSKLTPDILKGFTAHGLTAYQGITLASIVYAESGSAASEPTVAQVFLSRLKQGMPLGSDVTAFYAADLAGAGKTLGVDSPYNTRLHTGLPPGPIGNFTDIALKAVAHPSNTDFLYFVAGDDGTIHFSHTEAEHEQAIAQYCHKQCS
jgi:UPF0755 protein